MYAVTSASKQTTTSTASRQQSENGSGPTLQRNINGQDLDSLSHIVSNGSPANSFHFSPPANPNSPSSHLSHLVHTSPIQAKLTIGKPNDRYEREADRMAEKVMTSPLPIIQRASEEEREEPVQTKLLIPSLQRQAEEKKEETVQTKPLLQRQEEEKEEAVQTKPVIQKQEEEKEEPVQTKLAAVIQRQEKEEKEEPEVQTKPLIQRQEEEKEEEVQTKPLLQRQEEEKEEAIQTKPVIQKQEEEKEEPVQTKLAAPPVIQRQNEEEKEEPEVQIQSLIQRQEEEEKEEEEVQTKPLIQRQEEKEKKEVQAKPDINLDHRVPASIENAIRTSKAGGVPLNEQTQIEMGGHFDADFSSVRVHTDTDAVRMNHALNAQAFTHGSHVYFGEGKYNPHNSSGRRLLAHELTHVVQQGAAVHKKPASLSRSPQLIQRLPGVITSLVNRYARHIPGYVLFTVIIGFNPLTGRSVARTAENLLGGLMGLVPFGTALYDKLVELGIVGSAFTFVRSELERFDLSLERLERTIENAYDDMGLNPFEYPDILRRHFGALVRDVRRFASSIASRVLSMIKEALLGALRGVARRIPGYSLFTKILGRDPLSGETIERNTAQIIEEFLILIGRRQHLQKMRETGTIERVANWIDTQLALLNFSFAEIRALFTEAWDAFSFRDVLDPIGAFNRTVNIFRPFVSRVFTFAYNVATTVLRFIKDALISALSSFARRVPGYTLLTVILGRDPFTGSRVERNATNLIRGFMEFIPGGREKFRNLQESGAIDRAFEWLSNEVEKLNLSWDTIRELFRRAWESLSIRDLINPIGAFRRIVNLFRAPVRRIIRFAAAVGMKILEFIFEGIMGAGGTRVLNILKRARDTFMTIINDPVAFIRHLIDAVALGFRQFGRNIRRHLISGLVGWLFGALEGAGLQLPERFDLRGIISLVLQILGLTYQRIRPRLVRLLGERTVSILERTFAFLRTLVTEGPAGAWRQIVEYAGNLRDRVMEGIRNFVITRIVTAAVMRLATMWNPAGAVIQAIIGIYNTIMFFVERINQILALVESVTNSISSIASGNIAAAANFIEQSMARAIPVMISFFARLLGLGNISGAIRNIIRRIRRPIDRAIDRVVAWIVRQARRLGSAIRRGARRVAGWLGIRKSFTTVGGESHTLFFRQRGNRSLLMIRTAEMSLETFLADLARKYARDPDKLTRVNRAQQLVTDIRNMTAPSAGGTSTSASSTSASIDAAVQAKIDQLGPILQEIGDGVSTEGATAAYRGLHWWIDPTRTAAENTAEYTENLNRQVLGARQLSDAVRVILSRRIPTGRIPTEDEVDAAVNTVRTKMSDLGDGSSYEAEGKTYYDRLMFLLGRYITSLSAFQRNIARAAELDEIDRLQTRLGTLARGTDRYYLTKRRIQELQRSGRRGVPSAYRDLQPEVEASPFVATSLDAVRTAKYALGDIYKPQGKEKRTVGIVGRILIFVASVAQLIRDGTYSIDELRNLSRIIIRPGFSEREVTFVGEIPGEYLRAQLEVQAGQSENAIAGNARGRAAAEAQRFGGLK